MRKNRLAILTAGLLGLPGTPSLAEDAPPADSGAVNLEALESRVRSTLLFGGSSPVSFSGEARLKLQEHYLTDHPGYMATDKTWTQANYEGNESFLRLGMVARPNRNVVLWSKIGFQHTLPGNFLNSNGGPGADGYRRVQDRHDKTETVANIHEDMSAGLAIRTVPASAWLKMGNVLWTEASPLTIWKAQPRTFAWEYLPYEVEQPVARYYEYNVAKGEKTGRAAWNKKPFNGIEFRSIHLPLDLHFGLLYAAFERYDNFEREYVDYSGDLAYTGDLTEAKGRGIGDSHRHMLHLRFAKEKLLQDLTVGYNGVGILYKPDATLTTGFRQVFGYLQPRFGRNPNGTSLPYYAGEGFYKQPQIHSIDLRGSLGQSLEFHGDIALSQVDTVWYTYGADSVQAFGADGAPLVRANGTPIFNHFPKRDRRVTQSSWVPALFGKLRYKSPISLQADLAAIPKGFYSPFSFVAPMDAFFPFGSNMVGGGKFIARGEGSPYIQNMGGIQLTAHANPGYGHFRVSYGQHAQLEPARDLLFFPHRLNGQDLSAMFHSSYNRWGNNLIDHSLDAKYRKRLGDESYRTAEFQNPYGPDAGGLRTDYLSAYEGFVPYTSAAEAESSLVSASGASTTIYTRSPWVPAHRKWTFNLEVDGAWDFGPMVGYSRELFLGAYAALNGVSDGFRAVAFGPSDMMLWGAYFRLEPAMALSDKFYLLALAGYETWRSEMAYMDTPAQEVVATPIDYHDVAFGVGFDWDFAARVGLHTRFKWMKHMDSEFTDNNWTNRLGSAEIKMWF
jgi:hypothetical protein